MGPQDVLNHVQTRYRRLANALASHVSDLIPDLSPLETAIQQMSIFEDTRRYVWSMSVDQLVLKLAKPPNGTVPSGCRSPFALRISTELSVEVIKPQMVSAFQRPTSLQMNLEFEADHKQGLKRGAWHLDLHSYPTTPGRGEIHPRVHWQNGGKAVNRWGITEVGGWILTDAPRLPYPPLDIVLAISWMLANFAEAHWHYVFDVDTDFTALVRDHQAWLWKPYFNSIASHWTAAPDPTRHLWWPELIV